MEAQLAALGPGTILGRQAINYQVLTPVTLPDGWTLVGYDLDEESLESGGPLEILLWWQKPDDVPGREKPGLRPALIGWNGAR